VPAGDVDEQCSRVEVVEDGAAVEDLAASGGDDAQYNRCLALLRNFSDEWTRTTSDEGNVRGSSF